MNGLVHDKQNTRNLIISSFLWWNPCLASSRKGVCWEKSSSCGSAETPPDLDLNGGVKEHSGGWIGVWFQINSLWNLKLSLNQKIVALEKNNTTHKEMVRYIELLHTRQWRVTKNHLRKILKFSSLTLGSLWDEINPPLLRIGILNIERKIKGKCLIKYCKKLAVVGIYTECFPRIICWRKWW